MTLKYQEIVLVGGTYTNTSNDFFYLYGSASSLTFTDGQGLSALTTSTPMWLPPGWTVTGTANDVIPTFSSKNYEDFRGFLSNGGSTGGGGGAATSLATPCGYYINCDDDGNLEIAFGATIDDSDANVLIQQDGANVQMDFGPVGGVPNASMLRMVSGASGSFSWQEPAVFQLSPTGYVSVYRGSTTAGSAASASMPFIVKAVTNAQETATTGTVWSFTTPATGQLYRAMGSIVKTASGSISLTLSWTDEVGNAHTVGLGAVSSGTTEDDEFAFINAQASSTITLTWTNASGLTFNVSSVLEQLTHF